MEDVLERASRGREFSEGVATDYKDQPSAEELEELYQTAFLEAPTDHEMRFQELVHKRFKL